MFPLLLWIIFLTFTFFIDSKTYSNLSPNMKDAVKDVFKFVEERLNWQWLLMNMEH